ncbi:MAG: hypothetical protein MRY78_04000 [Saprospiraceae bacterium]|nr:hypothetical protein [Saprospiraceae bacterium]
MRLVSKLSLALFCIAVSYASLHAEGWGEYNKTIKKDFAISVNGIVELSNKYGKVEVKTWDRNRVKLDIRITVRSNSEKSAQQVFDRIEINFTNTADLVKAITEIEPKKSTSFWGSWVSNDKSDYSIDYDVYLPPSINLEVSNKYGDLFIDEMSSPVSISIAHGNFKMDGSKDDVRLEVAHSNGTILRGKNVFFSAKHSNITLMQAGEVELSTKHSNVSIEQAKVVRCATKYDNYKISKTGELRNTGKYDNIEVGTVNDISVSAKYSQIKAMEVNNSVDFNLEHGGGNIRLLTRNFTEVQLDGRYSDFKIGIASGTDFRLDALGTYAGISYPRGLTPTYEVEKDNKHEVKGYRGNPNSKRKITAGLSYGGLKLYDK